MIQIQNLNKKYDDHVIFDKASITFLNQGLVCILGPSGCGKSTLLNLIAGFESDYEGTILVQGTSLKELNQEKLCAYRRDHVGFVFQNYHLISGYTSLDNVLLAADLLSHEEGKKEAEALLDKMGLKDKLMQKSETLSGGQKQRVAIARALCNNPSVILADEPTGALDRSNSTEIMTLLKTLAQDRLVVVITHDQKWTEYADQIVTIDKAKLISNITVPSEAEAELPFKKQANTSLWKRAAKNMKVHFSRSFAVSLAVAIGVLCLMLSLSSGNMMEKSIADFQAKNTAFHNGYIKAAGNESEIINLLKEDQRVENIYRQYGLKDITISSEDKSVIVPEKFPMAKAAEKMAYGVMPQQGKNEIALSPSLAAKYDKNIQNCIGKNITVHYNNQTYEVKVSGIYNASYDDFYISSDLEQKLYQGNSGQVISISYDVIQFKDIASVSDSLKDKGLVSQNAAAQVTAFLETFANLNRLFLTVSWLIFAAGLFTSAVLLVKQQNTRTSEIGLLSALGYTKVFIRQLLFYEYLLTALMSAAVNGILTAVSYAAGKIFGFTILYTVPQILLSVLLSSSLVLILGLLFASRLLKTEPAKALRN